MVNLVLWLHMLWGPCWCMSAALAADIHQQGPGNICSHTTRSTTPTYFNWPF